MRNIQMKMKKTTFITQGAVIAAIYAVLVFVFDYWSFGPIQFRVAEALTILPVFTPAAVPGLFIGCLIANITGGAVIWDIVFVLLRNSISAMRPLMAFFLHNLHLHFLHPVATKHLSSGFLLLYRE